MEIVRFEVGPLPTNAYLVVNGSGCVLIDGGDDRVLDYIKEKRLRLKKILLTHGHGDHLIGIAHIKKVTKAKVYVSKKDSVMLGHPYNLDLFGAEGVKADFFLKGKVDNFEVIETPGHTFGSVCLYDAKGGVLFSGDTIFHYGIGRFDLPNSSRSLLKESIKRLVKLPLDVKVYPGHGPLTVLGEELDYLSDVVKEL